MKQKRRLAAMLFAVLFAFSTVSVQAASYGITADIEKTYFEASYNYGKAGYLLKIEVNFTEKHSQTGQVYTDWCYDIKTGGYTTVSVARYADVGYNYEYINVYGYVNGVQQADLLNIAP